MRPLTGEIRKPTPAYSNVMEATQHCCDYCPNEFDERFVATEFPPGSVGKVAVLKARAVAGLPLWHPDDAKYCDKTTQQRGHHGKISFPSSKTIDTDFSDEKLAPCNRTSLDSYFSHGSHVMKIDLSGIASKIDTLQAAGAAVSNPLKWAEILTLWTRARQIVADAEAAYKSVVAESSDGGSSITRDEWVKLVGKCGEAVTASASLTEAVLDLYDELRGKSAA